MKINAKSLFASERMRHAAIAITLAVVFGLTTFLRPLDITVWSLQAKLFERQPSGDIVYVEIEYGEKAGQLDRQNRQLAAALRKLNDADAKLIVINMPLRKSTSEQSDAILRAALTENRERIVLTRTVIAGSDRMGKDLPSDAYFEHGLRLATNDYYSDFLGYVWDMGTTSSTGDQKYPPVWTLLAEKNDESDRLISLDYTINTREFPHYRYEADGPAETGMPTTFGGKAVIVGNNDTVKMPGQGEVNPVLLHVLAAETFKQGRGGALSWFVVTAVYALALIFGITIFRADGARRKFYGVWAGSIPVVIIAASFFGVRAGISESIALIAIYAGQRATVRYKRRHLLVEPRSGLPNFVAFRRDLEGDSKSSDKAVIVAKVARLDSIFTTLNTGEQARYLRQVAVRLALGDNGTAIYYDGGKYFAFFLDRPHYDDLESHLHGLRAIASQAITVGSRILDVSMTIGVDSTTGNSASTRLSAATAAADQAREAYRPVFVISNVDGGTDDWDHSLQARLEQALSEDRIAIALQPQADLQCGRILAAEALARWIDREKGDISPARFIGQCERVGRLDELTKRVLSKSLDAAETLESQGFQPDISVNVSAIQFVDDRIADLVEHELSQRSFDPSQLTIELTETARMENFATARATIERIKRLGPKFAIDDFGVASANLEVIFELPFDEIKIDRLFVSHLEDSATARAILANLVGLARDTRIISTAEGIENQATFNLLRDLGCDRGQGYFIARPLQVRQFMEMLVLQRDNVELSHRLG